MVLWSAPLPVIPLRPTRIAVFQLTSLWLLTPSAWEVLRQLAAQPVEVEPSIAERASLLMPRRHPAIDSSIGLKQEQWLAAQCPTRSSLTRVAASSRTLP